MIAIDNRKFVQEYWKAISGREKTPELLKKYIKDPELIKHINLFEAAFPKYEMVADDVICEKDKVFVRGHSKGVHKGDFMGIAPTGKTLEVPFMVEYKIEENKIAKSWMLTDTMEMMNKLKAMSN